MSAKQSTFRKVYNFRDPDARGRVCLLVFSVVECFLQYITSGIFYTQFLQSYNVDITGVGILNFVPFLASMLVFFTPGILSRFPRRRWLLAGCKLSYYLLNVVGLTLLPAIIQDYSTLLVCMIAVSFLSSLFNVVATAGYAAWHIRFQPEEVREFAHRLVSGDFPHVRLRGFMTMAPKSTEEEYRTIFGRVRELCRSVWSELPMADQRMELSMGMSESYVPAAAEGATMVRVGRGLFVRE